MDRQPERRRHRRAGRGRHQAEAGPPDGRAGGGSESAFAWVAADEAYGQNRALRRWLEDHRLPYVMATRRDDLLAAPGGRRRRPWPAPLRLGLDGACRPRRAPLGGRLLIRRHPATGELATLVPVASTRWGIEECFQAATNNTGLDHYQVHTYVGWYRHTTLPMLAHTRLAVLHAQANNPPTPAAPTSGLVPLSVNEIRRPAAALILPPRHEPAHTTRCSR